MFNYPDFKPQPIQAAMQKCLDCRKWFELSEAEVFQLQEDWKDVYAGRFVPVRTCTCPHCGERSHVTPVGKYDKPGTLRKACHILWVQLGEKAKAPKPYADQVEDMYAQVHDLLAPKFPISQVKAGNKDMILLDTKDENVKIAVHYKSRKFLRVSIAFQQRPGVWHELGNFPNSQEWDAVTQQFNVEDSEASIAVQYGQLDDVVKFAQQLAA